MQYLMEQYFEISVLEEYTTVFKKLYKTRIKSYKANSKEITEL